MVSFKVLVVAFSIANSLNALSLFSSNEQKPIAKLIPGEEPVPGDSPISICDTTEKQILDLKSVTITPNPPERGANLTVHAVGFLNKDVTEGAYVDVDVRYGYIKLVSQTFDLCNEIGEVDLECPLEKGSYDLTKSFEIPGEVPPGKYVVYARAFTKDDEYITCITGSVVFNVESWKIIS